MTAETKALRYRGELPEGWNLEHVGNHYRLRSLNNTGALWVSAYGVEGYGALRVSKENWPLISQVIEWSLARLQDHHYRHLGEPPEVIAIPSERKVRERVKSVGGWTHYRCDSCDEWVAWDEMIKIGGSKLCQSCETRFPNGISGTSRFSWLRPVARRLGISA